MNGLRFDSCPDLGPCVYRVYNADGVLIYIGSTYYFDMRRKAHQRIAPWFTQDLRWVVTRYDSEDEAKAAERNAIRTEHPLANKACRRPGPPTVLDIALIDDGLATAKKRVRRFTSQLLRIPDAATALGISKDSVYRLISTGALRAVAGPGGRTRVVEADLDAYVASLTAVGGPAKRSPKAATS